MAWTESDRRAVVIGRSPAWQLAGLLALTLLLSGAGLGLRDPWPSDEPRFALIARDMVVSGQWLLPHVGGDLYAEKPPLYFWLLAAFYALTGSIRFSILIPSLLSACGIAWLVHDLSRRLFGSKAALLAGVTLATTIQFVLATRSAQIDATLALLTTFSLYALLRHLLLGPDWRMYFLGGLAAGLGVITKGVGFLPLLILLPYFWMRQQGFRALPHVSGGARWLLAPAGMLLGIGIWLVPMLWVTSGSDPALREYRDALLFQQTIERYADAWHHIKPWYYFLLDVIPGLWLPLSALFFWLAPRWLRALRERDAAVLLPLAWTVLVVLFFSASSGKRGTYILPALPALAVSAAPYLPEIFSRRGIARLSVLLAGVLVASIAALLVGQMGVLPAIARELGRIGLDSAVPLAVVFAGTLLVWLITSARRPLLAWPAVLSSFVVLVSILIYPLIDPERSGRAFIRSALAEVSSGAELGMAGYKEQFLLYLDRPVTHFGAGRWREGLEEAYDAARWLNSQPNRVLLLPEALVAPCFEDSPHKSVGESARQNWFLVRAPAAPECAQRGESTRVVMYRPPEADRQSAGPSSELAKLLHPLRTVRIVPPFHEPD